MVGFLVLNCWSTPLIQLFSSRSICLGFTRLCCVLLGLVSYIAIPLALFVPYYQQFDKQSKTFDVNHWHRDVWMIQMMNELQVLFVTSVYDGLSKFVVALSITRWLHSITKIIARHEMLAPTRASIVPVPVSVGSQNSLAEIASSACARSSTAGSIPRRATSPRKYRAERAGNRFLTLWGLFILCAHLRATTIPRYPQCRLRTRPWFTSKPGCSLLEVNCVEEKVVDTALDIERVIRTVEASHIEYLALRHCASLEIPAYLTNLNHLLGLKIFNASIANWGKDAAITGSSHPMLRLVILIAVNATEFPQGLLSPKFPQTLSQVVLSKSNITEIPDTLDTIWPKRLILFSEELQLKAFPYILTRLLPVYLSLALNNLTTIPEAIMRNPLLPLLVLNGNSIQSLHTNLSFTPHLGWLSLVSTEISYLPEWMTGNNVFLRCSFIFATNTPLCDRMIANGEITTALSMGPKGLAGVDCFLDLNKDGTLNWYPIDHEDTINPSYTLA